MAKLLDDLANRLTQEIEFESPDMPEMDDPAIREIAAILKESPLLVNPVKKWLRMKQAEMASAQLSVLYTPEELEEMRQRLNG